MDTWTGIHSESSAPDARDESNAQGETPQLRLEALKTPEKQTPEFLGGIHLACASYILSTMPTSGDLADLPGLWLLYPGSIF